MSLRYVAFTCPLRPFVYNQPISPGCQVAGAIAEDPASTTPPAEPAREPKKRRVTFKKGADLAVAVEEDPSAKRLKGAVKEGCEDATAKEPEIPASQPCDVLHEPLERGWCLGWYFIGRWV